MGLGTPIRDLSTEVPAGTRMLGYDLNSFERDVLTWEKIITPRRL